MSNNVVYSRVSYWQENTATRVSKPIFYLWKTFRFSKIIKPTWRTVSTFRFSTSTRFSFWQELSELISPTDKTSVSQKVSQTVRHTEVTKARKTRWPTRERNDLTGFGFGSFIEQPISKFEALVRNFTILSRFREFILSRKYFAQIGVTFRIDNYLGSSWYGRKFIIRLPHNPDCDLKLIYLAENRFRR